MQGTVRLIQNCTMSFPRKNTGYTAVSTMEDCYFLSFGYDPLYCPECNHKMEFLELYYNHKRVSLEEMYEKVMSKSRGKRSSA